MKSRWMILLVAAALAFAAAPVTATSAEAGVSGQCYDENGEGDQDEARVGVDGYDADTTLPSGTGAAYALKAFVDGHEGDPETEDACRNPDGENGETKDYVEAHAFVGDTQVQVCYDKDGLHTGDPACPGSPGGPAEP